MSEEPGAGILLPGLHPALPPPTEQPTGRGGRGAWGWVEAGLFVFLLSQEVVHESGLNGELRRAPSCPILTYLSPDSFMSSFGDHGLALLRASVSRTQGQCPE